MIQADRLDRVRTVQDVDNEGTKISAEVFRTDNETVFPLQAALGYDLAQTLFVGEHNLLLQGPSDILYLQLLNEALATRLRSRSRAWPASCTSASCAGLGLLIPGTLRP
jgi:hypothetical protein